MIIYKLTNKITNQKYIGQTIRSLETRIKQSRETIEKRRLLNTGKKRNEESKRKMSLARIGKPNYSKKRIIAINKNTHISIGFYSLKDASEFLNIGRKSITNNLIKRSKSSGGYIFKYALENEGVN